MATIKKIIRSNTISQFTQVAPDGGGGFRLLADGLNELYGRVAPVALDQLEARGKEVGRNAAKKQIGNKRAPQANVNSIDLIKGFEGFIGGAKHDVNALRLGHGSDTITAADGSIKKVKAGDTVTREDADRDLNRRVSTEFAPKARKAIGEDRFDAMSESQQAAVTSIAYNYGSVPQRILGALKTGTDEEVAQAIQGLGGDNDGINRGRRNKEAEIFLNGGNQVVSKNSQQTEVLVRTSDGKLEGRLFSPYSGPLLQAHNAAAGVAYQAEIMEQGAVDLQNLSNDFLLDPDGFAQAADGYIGNIVEQAPDQFKSDIRDVLESEVTRRRFGIMEDKQRDTRQRAINSSKALVDRWSTNYAEALASGNDQEAEAARIRLDSILQTLEALPGATHTKEQSANVFIAAQKDAQSIKQKERTAQDREYREGFSLITSAAKAGSHAVNEGLLNNPDAIAAHPEEAREAQAFVTVRDEMPEFLKMTPGEQKTALDKMQKADVSEEWELNMLAALETTYKENQKLWGADPVKRAGEVLEVPLARLSPLTAEDPSQFITDLSERVKRMDDVLVQGYTETRAYLSESEAELFAAFFNNDTPAEFRAAGAAAIVSGAGSAAIQIFDEINAHSTTKFAGKIMAIGGKPKLAAEMLQGQQMLDEGVVEVPPKSDRIAAFSPSMANAMRGIPKAIQAQADVMGAARALYAARAQGVDPKSDAATDLMSQVINEVMGQSTNKRGKLTGGVQQMMGHDTLLPVGVSGERAEQSLRIAIGGPAQDLDTFGGYFDFVGDAVFGDLDLGVKEDAWIAATGGQGIINTGQTTPEGRPIWFNGDEIFSEKTITEQGPDGKFYNVLTIGPNGEKLSNKDALELAFSTGKAVDPITKAPLTPYDGNEEAVSEAEARSASMPEVDFVPPSRGPHFGGKPITLKDFEDKVFRLISAGGSKYRIEAIVTGVVKNVKTQTGEVFFFDLNRLMGAIE